MTKTTNLKKILEGIQTEIIAGSIIGIRGERDVGWNEANQRAKRIIQTYVEGRGLFND